MFLNKCDLTKRTHEEEGGEGGNSERHRHLVSQLHTVTALTGSNDPPALSEAPP